MNLTSIFNSVSIPYLVLYGLLLYAISIIIFMILENRKPESTFAWMFALIFLPVLGVLIYFFFGRERKAFSRENRLARQEAGGQLSQALASLTQRETEIIDRMKKQETAAYKRKLLELVRRNSNAVLTAHNEVEILQDAREKYPRLMSDIRAAKHSIHMDYYIWEADEFTEQVRDLLIEKVSQGVQVRILYDAVGNLKALDRRYVQSMRAGGIEIYSYLNWLLPYKIHTVGYRNHRKIVIIDGQIGYIGGLNMSKEHLDGGHYFAWWRDTHLRIVGEAAAVLQSIFVTSWYNTTYERLSDECYFAAVQNPPENYLPVQITTSGPDSQWAAIKQLYLFMILAAEDHVYIQSPFFIPDASIAEALKAAALAGVDVRIMCTPRGTTYSVPYWAANTYFAEMAEAGIKIYLYQKGYFHPKTISIDSEMCSIGTANMDIRSFIINYEANAVIYDRGIAAELEHDFLNDMTNCIEFSLEEYEERNVFLRFRDSLARLASPIL